MARISENVNKTERREIKTSYRANRTGQLVLLPAPHPSCYCQPCKITLNSQFNTIPILGPVSAIKELCYISFKVLTLNLLKKNSFKFALSVVYELHPSNF